MGPGRQGDMGTMGTWGRGQTPLNSTAKLFYALLLAMFVLFLIEIFDYDSENQYDIWVLMGSHPVWVLIMLLLEVVSYGKC